MNENLKILNVRDDFDRIGYNYDSWDMNIRKEFENRLILYERRSDNTLKLYYYDKNTGDIDLVAKLLHISKANEEWINIDLVTESDIYYTMGGSKRLTFYRYNIHGKYREIIFEGKYSFSIFLDKRYVLLGTEWDKKNDYDLYLYDMVEKKKYPIWDKNLKDTDYEGTRKVRLNGKFYLVHNKKLLDFYHINDLIEKESYIPNEYRSGIYLIEYDKFIRGVKRGQRNLSWDCSWDAKEDSCIEHIEYGGSIPSFIHEHNYHFIDVNFKKKNIKLYELNTDIENRIYKDHLESISYAEYDDAYNLVCKSYPVQILKYTYYDTYKEINVLHPNKYKFKIKKKDNESLLNILDNMIITSLWKEKKLDNGDYKYKEYVRIRDLETMKILKEVEGSGSLLSDNKTLVIV